MSAAAPLALPLSGGNNRIIRDAAGKVVSISEHADEFMAAMNSRPAMIAALKVVIPILRESRVLGSTLAYGQACAALVDAAGYEAVEATYPAESPSQEPNAVICEACRCRGRIWCDACIQAAVL